MTQSKSNDTTTPGSTSVEAIKSALFFSIGRTDLIKCFVSLISSMMDSKFTNLSIHAPNSDLEGIVTEPQTTPAQLKIIPKINQYIEQQPVLRHLRENKDKIVYTKISDFMPIAKFRETELYKEGYGPMGFDFMLTAAAWDNHGRLYALNLTHPERDFSEFQRQQLQQIFPSFLKAFQLNNLTKLRSEEIQNVLILTNRQKLILHWVGVGKTNQEIATITKSSAKNVEKHVRNLCKSFGFTKRVQLLDYCMKQQQIQFLALKSPTD